MAPGSDECLVRDVKLRDGQLGPVLVKFEHAELKSHDAAELECGVYTSNRSDSVCTVAAVTGDGDVVYQGDVKEQAEDICRTFLAVRNKRSNKMRIYEASSVMLSPTMRSTFVDHFDQQDKEAAHYKLQHAFGSKKAKRIADQRVRMTVNVDTVKEKLSATVNDITINEETLAPVQDDMFVTMLPPCNREASSPADVYPISGILDKKEIKSLVKYLSEAEESDQNLDPSRLTPFYQSMVEKASQRSQDAALLLYAESLIRLCKMKKIVPATKICLYSDLVNKKIMKDFCSGKSHVIRLSQYSLDKAIMHIIILGLHINGFSVNLETITRSIPFANIARIRTLARMVGAQHAKAPGSPTDLIELRLPLPSIEVLQRRPRPGGRR